MERCEALIRNLTGQQMVSHRAPGGVIHDYTVDLLVERGYIASSNWRDSDGPFLHSVNGKPVPLVEAVSYTHLDVYKRQPFCYTLFVVFGSLQFQTTTKNEIGNPFGEVYLIFFILGYFATAPFSIKILTSSPKTLSAAAAGRSPRSVSYSHLS